MLNFNTRGIESLLSATVCGDQPVRGPMQAISSMYDAKGA